MAAGTTTAAFQRRPYFGRRVRRGFVCALALLAGLLLRLWFLRHYSYVFGDTLLYGDIARNLLQHHIYGITNGAGAAMPIRPTLIRLPGYPLFLALCFRLFGLEQYKAVLAVQIVIDLGTCVLLAALTRRLFDARAGLAALWLAALCPFTANYTVAPLTETLTLFTIALAFYALDRWRTAAAADWRNRWLYLLGVALACSVLLRPEQGLLPAAIVPAVLWFSFRREPLAKAVRAPLLLAALTVLPLVPWTARNWHTFHVLQPLAPRFAIDPGESNPSGFQRWYRTWAIDFASTETIYWNYDGTTLAISDLPNRAFDTQGQYGATETLLTDYNRNTTSTPALDARFNALARERIASDPLRYAFALPAARLLNMAFRPRLEMLPLPLEWWKFHAHPRTTLFACFYAALNLVYFALAAATLWHWRACRPELPIILCMLAFIALRSALLLTIDNSEPRYTLEFFPVLIVLAAARFTLAQTNARKPCP